MPPSVHFARTRDGRSIAYSAAGAGPTMVFVRAWITHLELSMGDPSFAAFVGALTEHLRLVRYDGRGNGLSDRHVDAPVALDDVVEDLRAVLDRLGDDPVILWGSSFGGPAAIRYAADRPDRVASLVLDGTFASGPRLGTAEQREQFLAMLQMSRVQPDGLFAALSFLTDPEPGGGHEARVRRLRNSISPDAVVALYSALYEFDVVDDLERIAVPTLVLHRRGSRAIPFDHGRHLAAAIPGAQLVALEGRAHNLWEERPDEALLAIGRFLGLDDALAVAATGRGPADSSLPLAILFTDLVGSTELTGRVGDEVAQQVLRVHDAIVRDALGPNRGREVKHTGDGIMAAFPAVSAALACAATVQQEVARHNGQLAGGDGHELHVRIGINAGEPLSQDDDLFGTVVQLASRLCEHAGPDEVLVSNLVRELAAGKGFRFDDRGSRDCKGFDEPIRCWALDWRG